MGTNGSTQPNYAMRKYFFLIAVIVLLLDRLAKWVVATNIPLHESIVVIPGFFHLTHVQNTGAAFGLFADSSAQWKVGALVSFSVVALVVVFGPAVEEQSFAQRHHHWIVAHPGRSYRQFVGPHGQRSRGRLPGFLRWQLSLAGLQCRRQRDRAGRNPAGVGNCLRQIPQRDRKNQRVETSYRPSAIRRHRNDICRDQLLH